MHGGHHSSILNFLVVLIIQVNTIIGNGANYMYLAKAPIADNPLSVARTLSYCRI